MCLCVCVFVCGRGGGGDDDAAVFELDCGKNVADLLDALNDGSQTIDRLLAQRQFAQRQQRVAQRGRLQSAAVATFADFPVYAHTHTHRHIRFNLVPLVSFHFLHLSVVVLVGDGTQKRNALARRLHPT